MKTRNFSFNLPQELIAQYPGERRDSSRLLVLERQSGKRTHSVVSELPRFLEEESLIVFNDTRVRRARIYAEREDSGGRVEFLLLHPDEAGFWLTVTSKSRKQKPGMNYLFPGGVRGTIAGEKDGNKLVSFSEPVTDSYLERYGKVPLPPYIRREDEPEDAERYQTVYGKHVGSVAAPTAGLHFTEDLLGRLRGAGHEIAFVTLHVGLGTFAPVRTEDVEAHRMHSERFSVSAETAEKVRAAKVNRRNVVAVGTTSVRTLESLAHSNIRAGRTAWELQPGSYQTDIFIYPGFQFQLIDTMFTNFHTPESTLLMLACAFGGTDLVLESYREAVQERYRFFSYGDAMLIT